MTTDHPLLCIAAAIAALVFIGVALGAHGHDLLQRVYDLERNVD